MIMGNKRDDKFDAIMKVLKELFFVTCQDHVDRLDKAAKEIIKLTESKKVTAGTRSPSTDLLYWRNVKDELPTRGFSFLVYCQNQSPLMMIAWTDIHGNYVLQGNGDTAGFGKYPKFSHWMPLPKKPV